MGLSRKISPYITSYYLPSGLLVCLSWVTFFVPIEAVLGRLSVAMIPLFFLVHLLVSISSSFPKSTDGMNALEIWICPASALRLQRFWSLHFSSEEMQTKLDYPTRNWRFGVLGVISSSF